MQQQVEAAFADVRDAHPEFTGTELALASAATPERYVYASDDLRPRFSTDLGRVTS